MPVQTRSQVLSQQNSEDIATELVTKDQWNDWIKTRLDDCERAPGPEKTLIGKEIMFVVVRLFELNQGNIRQHFKFARTVFRKMIEFRDLYHFCWIYPLIDRMERFSVMFV